MPDSRPAVSETTRVRPGPDSVPVHWCPEVPGPRPLDGQALTARLAAFGLVAREIAQDLKTLRHCVPANGGLRGPGPCGTGLLDEALERLERATDRASALSQCLNASGRRRSARFPALSLNALVRQTLHNFGQLADAGIAVRTHLDRTLWLVHADPKALERVIAALLARAQAALPEGGTLTLRTENVTRDEKIHGCHPKPMAGGWACLVVEDSARASEGGPLHRILEPFRGPGTADGEPVPGLAALLGLVRQLGGRLRVQTLPDCGASFRIYLPASPGIERTQPNEEHAGQSPGPGRAGPTAVA